MNPVGPTWSSPGIGSQAVQLCSIEMLSYRQKRLKTEIYLAGNIVVWTFDLCG